METLELEEFELELKESEAEELENYLQSELEKAQNRVKMSPLNQIIERNQNLD